MNITNTNNQKKSAEKNKSFAYAPIFLGVFFLLGGIILLINNFSPIPPVRIAIFLFISASYLIVLAIMRQIRKLYYVLGLILLSLCFSVLIKEFNNSSIVWPILMIILGLGISCYGFIFKKTKYFRYIIPGGIFLAMGLLVFLVVQSGDNNNYESILKLWPLAIVLLGGYQFYIRQQLKKIQKDFSLEEHSDEDTGNEEEDFEHKETKKDNSSQE